MHNDNILTERFSDDFRLLYGLSTIKVSFICVLCCSSFYGFILKCVFHNYSF